MRKTNDTRYDFKFVDVSKVFEKQAEKHPDKTAVICKV